MEVFIKVILKKNFPFPELYDTSDFHQIQYFDLIIALKILMKMETQ